MTFNSPNSNCKNDKGLKAWQWLAGVVLTSFVLALLTLDTRSLWYDEILTLKRIQLDWPGLLSLIGESQLNMAPHYILLKYWISLFGDSEFSLRFPSLIFAAASLPVAYAAGKELLGTRIALLGAGFMGVNGFFIYYAQEARAYSLALFFGLCSSYFFIKCVKSSHWKHWIGFVLCGVLAAYCHFFAILVLVSHAASLWFLPKNHVDWKKAGWAFLAIVVCFAPLAYFILFGDTHKTNWQPTTHPGYIFWVLYSMGGLGTLGPLVLLGFAIRGVKLSMRTARESRWTYEAWVGVFLVAWAFAPVALAFLISLVKPLFKARYFLISLPAYLLLASLGVAQIRARWKYLAAVSLLVILSAHSAFLIWRHNDKENWRQVTQLVVSKASPGDGLIFIRSGVRKPFDYYLGKMEVENDFFGYIFPPLKHKKKSFPKVARKMGQPLIDWMAKDHSRIWLVLGHAGRKKAAVLSQEWLREKYSRRTQWDFYRKLKVILYQK